MRLYISGPMTGYPGDNRAEFKRVTAELRALGHQVVDPTEMDLEYNDAGEVSSDSPSPLWRMFITRDVAIILSSQFDGIVALEGWRKSKGARAEVFMAVLCGTPVFDERYGPVCVTGIDLSDCPQRSGPAPEGMVVR